MLDRAHREKVMSTWGWGAASGACLAGATTAKRVPVHSLCAIANWADCCQEPLYPGNKIVYKGQGIPAVNINEDWWIC